MNKQEFKEQLYADPNRASQELLDAAAGDAELKRILDETRAFEGKVRAAVHDVQAPEQLKARLMAIPEQESLAGLRTQPAANNSVFNYFALAASLVLAIGLSVALNPDRAPTPEQIAMGAGVFEHLYSETDEILAIGNGQDQSVIPLADANTILASAGTRLVSNSRMDAMEIRSAKPCVILPAYQSAHLMVQGNQGTVSVIVINNSPVDLEYQIRDDRFAGLVVPTASGNMILVGEQGEDLRQYKTLFSESTDLVL